MAGTQLGYHRRVLYRILEFAPGPRLTMSVAEAAKVLGMPRSSAYAAVACGAIPSIRIGRHIVVPRAAVDRVLQDNQPAPENG